MTTISTLYNKILISMPLFSVIYFVLSWLLVVASSVFMVYFAAKPAEKNNSFGSYAEEDQEDLRSFISGSGGGAGRRGGSGGADGTYSDHFEGLDSDEDSDDNSMGINHF